MPRLPQPLLLSLSYQPCSCPRLALGLIYGHPLSTTPPPPFACTAPAPCTHSPFPFSPRRPTQSQARLLHQCWAAELVSTTSSRPATAQRGPCASSLQHTISCWGEMGKLEEVCYEQSLVSKLESAEHYTELWCAEARTRKCYYFYFKF